MVSPTFLALTVALGTLPFDLAFAALFPKNTHVTLLDAKGFKTAMQEDRTSVVAFVAPWCGHCQRLVPEYIKAAKALHPLVPVYAVDCDAEPNKRLCGEQGVQGFPTVKLFPRGSKHPPQVYEGPRTASSLFHSVSNAVPQSSSRSKKVQGLKEWVERTQAKPRAVLLNKSEKLPLLWKILANQWKDKITFGDVQDNKGVFSSALGFPESEESKSKVVFYGKSETEPVEYEGALKFEALSKFLKKVAEGSADLTPKTKPAEETAGSDADSSGGDGDSESRDREDL